MWGKRDLWERECCRQQRRSQVGADCCCSRRQGSLDGDEVATQRVRNNI